MIDKHVICVEIMIQRNNIKSKQLIYACNRRAFYTNLHFAFYDQKAEKQAK
jgi:hypothetical protein